MTVLCGLSPVWNYFPTGGQYPSKSTVATDTDLPSVEDIYADQIPMEAQTRAEIEDEIRHHEPADNLDKDAKLPSETEEYCLNEQDQGQHTDGVPPGHETEEVVDETDPKDTEVAAWSNEQPMVLESLPLDPYPDMETQSDGRQQTEASQETQEAYPEDTAPPIRTEEEVESSMDAEPPAKAEADASAAVPVHVDESLVNADRGGHSGNESDNEDNDELMTPLEQPPVTVLEEIQALPNVNDAEPDIPEETSNTVGQRHDGAVGGYAGDDEESEPEIQPSLDVKNNALADHNLSTVEPEHPSSLDVQSLQAAPATNIDGLQASPPLTQAMLERVSAQGDNAPLNSSKTLQGEPALDDVSVMAVQDEECKVGTPLARVREALRTSETHTPEDDTSMERDGNPLVMIREAIHAEAEGKQAEDNLSVQAVQDQEVEQGSPQQRVMEAARKVEGSPSKPDSLSNQSLLEEPLGEENNTLSEQRLAFEGVEVDPRPDATDRDLNPHGSEVLHPNEWTETETLDVAADYVPIDSTAPTPGVSPSPAVEAQQELDPTRPERDDLNHVAPPVEPTEKDQTSPTRLDDTKPAEDMFDVDEARDEQPAAKVQDMIEETVHNLPSPTSPPLEEDINSPKEDMDEALELKPTVLEVRDHHGAGAVRDQTTVGPAQEHRDAFNSAASLIKVDAAEAHDASDIGEQVQKVGQETTAHGSDDPQTSPNEERRQTPSDDGWVPPDQTDDPRDFAPIAQGDDQDDGWVPPDQTDYPGDFIDTRSDDEAMTEAAEPDVGGFTSSLGESNDSPSSSIKVGPTERHPTLQESFPAPAVPFPPSSSVTTPTTPTRPLDESNPLVTPDLRRHHHGSSGAVRTTSATLEADRLLLDVESPATRTRSQCNYHKVQFDQGAQAHTMLIPRCSVGSLKQQSDVGASDLGPASEEDMKRKQSLLFGDHFLQKMKSEEEGTLPVTLEHRLSLLVGRELLREGHIFILPLEEGVEHSHHEDDAPHGHAGDDDDDDVEHEEGGIASRTRGRTASRTPSVSLGSDSAQKRKRRGSSASTRTPASVKKRKSELLQVEEEEQDQGEADDEMMLGTTDATLETGRNKETSAQGASVTPSVIDHDDKVEEQSVAESTGDQRAGWFGWLWGNK